MSWPKYVLIAVYVLSALLTVAAVGKPKKPTTPGVAAASLVVSGVFVWLVVIA